MKNEIRSQAFLRKRRMLLVLPLLVIPFLTMAFWAFGGGSAVSNAKSGLTNGLNLDLPTSKIEDDKGEDKLSFYDRAQRDSSKLAEWMRNDPYYTGRQDSNQNAGANSLEGLTTETASKFHQQLNTTPYEANTDQPEQQLMQKIAVLQKELNKPAANKEKPSASGSLAADYNPVTEHMNRLQSMMEGIQPSDAADPEMKQIGTTLEKILDIQHPDRVRERLKEKSARQKGVVFAVTKTNAVGTSSLLPDIKAVGNIGFYGVQLDTPGAADGNSIAAEIYSDQTLINGAVVRLRLINEVLINGQLVRAGTFVNGLAQLNDERLNVVITTIRTGNSLFPVRLSVYDLDGLPGLYIPGAISRDVAKQSANNSLQLLELSAMDPSLKAQAAATGINAAKSLLSRKVKQIKVFVKAGYQVLLRNDATNE